MVMSTFGGAGVSGSGNVDGDRSELKSPSRLVILESIERSRPLLLTLPLVSDMLRDCFALERFAQKAQHKNKRLSRTKL